MYGFFFHHSIIRLSTVWANNRHPSRSLFDTSWVVGSVVLRRLPPTHPQHARCLRAATENVKPGFFSSKSPYGAVQVLDIYKVTGGCGTVVVRLEPVLVGVEARGDWFARVLGKVVGRNARALKRLDVALSSGAVFGSSFLSLSL